MRTGFFRVLGGVSAFRQVRDLGTQTPSVNTASLLQRPIGDSTQRSPEPPPSSRVFAEDRAHRGSSFLGSPPS